MPLADIEWVLEGAHRFCDSRGLAFDAYPMHELAAHPDAARLFGLFNAHSATARGGTMFEPWPTTGVPLAIRDDWRTVLRAAADTGTVNIWVAFHGIGDVHDRQVNRRGAYAETCLAVGRARAAGLSVGGNVFLTTASLPQLDELTAALRRLPVNADLSFETAAFLPTPRSRRNEPLRPTLTGLLPVAAQIAELTAPADRPWWADLEAHTEAACVRRALAGDWPAARDRTPGELALICRSNLDVCSGLAGHYRTRYGNLRAEGIATVLDRAVAGGRRPDDELWFSPGPLPSPAELAARHGQAAGLGVHPGPESARYLWLDHAQRQALRRGGSDAVTANGPPGRFRSFRPGLGPCPAVLAFAIAPPTGMPTPRSRPSTPGCSPRRSRERSFSSILAMATSRSSMPPGRCLRRSPDRRDGFVSLEPGVGLQGFDTGGKRAEAGPHAPGAPMHGPGWPQIQAGNSRGDG